MLLPVKHLGMFRCLAAALLALLLLVFPLAGVGLAADPDETGTGVPKLALPVRAPILYFHEISSSRAFESILGGLLSAGYTPVPLASVVDGLLGDPVTLPDRPVVLTFDDGLQSQWDSALPVLLQYATPATFFVIPGYQDGVHRYMTPDNYIWLTAAGMDVESHTFTHTSLAARAFSFAYLNHDIKESRERLDSIIRPIFPDYYGRFFAYPNGSYNQAVAGFVHDSGYDAAVTTVRRARFMPADRYTLGRVRADGLSASQIVQVLSGL